jgi:hypothetical protein
LAIPANGTGVPGGNPGDFRRSQALGGLPLNPDAAPKLPSRPESGNPSQILILYRRPYRKSTNESLTSAPLLLAILVAWRSTFLINPSR